MDSEPVASLPVASLAAMLSERSVAAPSRSERAVVALDPAGYFGSSQRTETWQNSGRVKSWRLRANRRAPNVERGVAGVLWLEVHLVACRATPRPAGRRLGVGAASSCRQLQPLPALLPPRPAGGS